MRPTTVVFDLDGTLVDSLPDFTAAITRLFDLLSLPPLSADDLKPMLGDGPARFLERALAARGRQADAGLQARFLADYTAHAAAGSTLFDGMAETLHALRQRGYRLAICTNKPRLATERLLAALAIDGLFEAVGAGDSFAFRKPDPRHLEQTLALLGVPATQALMVGDHRNDYEAAAGCGCAFVFAEWGYGGHSVSDLPADAMQRAARPSALLEALDRVAS